MTPNLDNKVLARFDLLNDGFYHTGFSLKIDFVDHPIPLRAFSNLWKEVADRGIEVVRVVATDESPYYFMKLFSEKGGYYIKEQLNDILWNFPND